MRDMSNAPSLSELSSIIDTYEGMIAMCPNGEGADYLFSVLEDAEARYNSALVEMGE